jgi:GDPmannose 4,6-dehydratase
MPTALIIGISGQDGAFLAATLLSKGYDVWGTSRDVEARDFHALRALGIHDKIKLKSMSSLELLSVLDTFDAVQPDEIYNLGGQSSVGLSFDQPAQTMTSIVLATLNLLEGLRTARPKARFYSAGSSECFGDTGTVRANEATPFRPCSPYAVAKASAHWQVASYREAYGLFAVSGLLFNHESRFRPARFVTSKIIRAAQRIADGSDETLVLGDIDIVRDWGHASEYADAMWRMVQQSEPCDLVIATGNSMSLRTFANAAFDRVGLDFERHHIVDQKFFRPNEIRQSHADPSAAAARLGWSASLSGVNLVRTLVDEFRQTPV